MKGRSAIRGCSQSELTTRKNETKLCGLWSLPDELAVMCMADLSRLDLAALAITSKGHRSLVVSPYLWNLRWRKGSIGKSLYVLLHIFPDPSPRWFIFHPVQRRLKPLNPVNSSLYPAPEAGSCFVTRDWGIFIIGGLINGKPTSEVSFFDCFEHRVYRFPPMKMARCGASASVIDKKIYVFGGCWDQDVADSSNWVEVFDIKTHTWDLLFVFTPKMPLKIQQSVVMSDVKEVYAVDEDGQIFSFSPSKCMFVPNGKTDSNPECRNDWRLFSTFLICRGIGGRILWRLPYELDWKEVKGLEELQQHSGCDDIIKLCLKSSRIVIFWKARPQGPDQNLELWYAEISLEKILEECEIWGKIECSGLVFSDSYGCVNFLHAATVNA